MQVSLRPVRFPNFQTFVEMFQRIYKAQYENATLVSIRDTPVWRPGNTAVNIWNLLWRLIISTEKKNQAFTY